MPTRNRLLAAAAALAAAIVLWLFMAFAWSTG